MSESRPSPSKRLKKTHAAVTGGGSALRRYQDVVVGRRSVWATLYYELCMILGQMPGALGLALRRILWPRLFGSCGRGVLFAENMVLRHPHRIHLGNRVVLSEGCVLDARNVDTDFAIVVGDDSILSNNAMLQCKDSTIRIGARVGIGTQTIIQATNHCTATIGSDVVIGPRCSIIAGGNYKIDRLDIPMSKQGLLRDAGVTLEDDIWLGTNVTVLSGVTMAAGSVAAAGAVITKSIPPLAVCAGMPARVVKTRGEGAA